MLFDDACQIHSILNNWLFTILVIMMSKRVYCALCFMLPLFPVGE